MLSPKVKENSIECFSDHEDSPYLSTAASRMRCPSQSSISLDELVPPLEEAFTSQQTLDGSPSNPRCRELPFTAQKMPTLVKVWPRYQPHPITPLTREAKNLQNPYFIIHKNEQSLLKQQQGSELSRLGVLAKEIVEYWKNYCKSIKEQQQSKRRS